MLLIFTKRRWANYWQLLRRWFEHKIDELKAAVNSVAQSIDFTPVNNKLDTISDKIDNIHIDTSDLAKQGSNAAATNTAILAAMPTIPTDYAKQGTNPNATNTDILAAFPQECSNEDIDRMFESITEEGYILIPSGLIRTNGKMSLSVFIAITGLTPVIVSNDVQEVVVTEDGYIIVPSSMISAFGTMSLRKFMQRTKLTPIY